MIPRALLISLLAGAAGALLASYKGRSAVLWFFLCFFMPVLVVLPILLPARPKGPLRRCSKCGTVSSASSASCPGCGTPFPIEMVECPSCGKYVRKGERCPECNSKLPR